MRDTAPDFDDPALEIIASLVIDALREDLRELANALIAGEASADSLTVGQVARRLGVARSTVYTHWREWGGYKLGLGERAPIRFVASQLPNPTSAKGAGTTGPVAAPAPRRTRRTRRSLIVDAPRLSETFDEGR